jgi:ComF family protein
MQKVQMPVCRRCGKQLRSESSDLCRDCRTLPHVFERGETVFTYHSAAGGIFRFKYRGRQEYGAYYGKCMADKLVCSMNISRRMPDYLVPVPVSAHRLAARGYNQAFVLAREISRRTGIPVRDDVLRRVADTLPMKNMTPAERQNNLKKAFQAFGNDVELNSIMLIDDIYTTGATIDACAHALYRQGARRVCFITLAAGVDSGF